MLYMKYQEVNMDMTIAVEAVKLEAVVSGKSKLISQIPFAQASPSPAPLRLALSVVPSNELVPSWMVSSLGTLPEITCVGGLFSTDWSIGPNCQLYRQMVRS
jgi:hypothetical protein